MPKDSFVLITVKTASVKYLSTLPHPMMAKCICLFTILFSCLQSKTQTADFTFSTPGGIFCSPTVVQFTQTASGTPSGFIWELGNGTVSNAPNPSVTYTNAGNYTVKLTVIYDNAAVAVSKTVTINPAASVSVSADRNAICKPGPVVFTASGIGPYLWNFGDGTIVTTASAVTTHVYAAFGNYNIFLSASNIQGCLATALTQVSIIAPSITASVSPQSGCIPATATFNATVTATPGSNVTNYAWNFGDATVTNTTAGSTSHIYNATGIFTPSLTITTNEGCTNTFNFSAIAFGTPPTNPVAYLKKDVICGSETLVLIGKAVNANNYTWSYGDGGTATVIDTITQHKYYTLGNKTITVTPSFNGCAGDTLTLNAFIKGVIASFTSANSCTSRQTFTFTNTGLGNISSTAWSFGDGTSADNINIISHAYPASGQYAARLIIADSVTGCVDSFKQTMFSAMPALSSNDTLLCKGSQVSVAIASNYTNPSALYTWSVAGDSLAPSANATITNYSTRKHGLFYNYVIIDNGRGYCLDTIRQAKPIRVRGLQMNFNAADNICFNSTLAVTNNSTPFYPADTARLYYWNYGDNPANDTIYQPAAHQYANPGNYVVALYGIDKNGCRDSLNKTVAVNVLPFVRSIPSVDTLCAGQIKTLISYHSDSVRWAPVTQVSCTNCDTIMVSPVVTTSFVATAFNTFGCTSSDTSIVKVFSPFTATTSFTNTSICLNDTIRLMAIPAGKKVLWLPPSGLSSATVYNPVASPAQTTQYRLALTDSAGCFSDTATLTVVIDSLPIVDAGPSQVFPYNALFNFQPTYSSNVLSYNWTPGNQLNCTNCAIPTGRNLLSQTYTVMVTSPEGCVAKDSVTILIECKDAYLLMPTAFSPDNNGLNDYYYPLTRGIRAVRNFAIYNRAGRLMYQATNFLPNDKRFGWDGRYKGEPQPTGAYVFMMEALCDAGQTLTRKGSFLLLK